MRAGFLIVFLLLINSSAVRSMEKIHTIIDYNHGLAISLALSDFNEIQNIDHEGYSLLLAEDSEFYVVTFFESNLEQGVRGGRGQKRHLQA
ncbi:hypothetical protein JLK41_13350 [Ectopseudomonas khazarica]|uniref:hypothetical protein n=1 Tax=Ectopseudomonas khazarica TaxID=2502979 RepID=UPI001AEF4889|nr:hypothetical protein [Pseudomonas khazarica]QTS84331.1 hypothetical protein JLK41_13350 [Pseudomonas khazarica]